VQLSSRILTALAVLILAVAVVAVRTGSPETVEAATGTIDVLNVGTCYTTDDEVFTVDDCDDGDGGDAYEVAERDTITETGTVYATYAHDPKTAPDSPRAILENSNLLKISITDTGRDKRTPVLLGVGGARPCDSTDMEIDDTVDPQTDPPTMRLVDIDCQVGFNSAEDGSGHIDTIRKDYSDIVADANDFRWVERNQTTAATDPIPNAQAMTFLGTPDPTAAERVITGITIHKNGLSDSLPYKPMYVADGDDSPISLYGTIGGLTPASEDGFKKLNKYLAIDEDVGPGRVFNEAGNRELEVAPWFSVKLNIPAGATVTVMYVVYETSEFESLVGGSTVGDENGKAAVGTTAVTEAKSDAPAFTTTELRSPNTALVVEARSDGRKNSQNLALRETSRFSGKYEGYLKLTDENGISKDGDGDATNWGLDNTDATRCEDRTGCQTGEAAILGVESGPVVIAYKDTDGTTQLLNVAIDTAPPMVEIHEPAHEAQIQDLSPEFSGAFSDAGSGLRRNSFRGYVDHTDDTNENGEDAGKLALDFRVDHVNGTVETYGVVTIDGDKKTVESHADYAGYEMNADGSVFGVIPHGDVFDLDATGNDENDEIKLVEGDSHNDGATSGTFGDSVRIAFRGSDEEYNDTIDFQALVADVAGNIGFSDSDADGPRFINNLGEEAGNKRKTGRYNVLGWYARHIFFLDEVNPDIFKEQSVTGFYGENDDDMPQVDRSGILVAFDRAVDEDSIDLGTFTVTLDPTGAAGSTGASAEIMDFDVEGRVVYLKLSNELASNATPMVDIASGKWVSDPAGNRLTGGTLEAFEVKDGISPIITVSLSEGSGSGEGDEGPSMLTKDSIVVTINADEEIATPSLVVVCSNITWDSADEDTENDKKLSDLVKSRTGGLDNSSADFQFPPDLKDTGETRTPNVYDCGSGDSGYGPVTMQQAPSYSRPGLTWEYQWVNFEDDKALRDGDLTVVAYARDRQSYASLTNREIDDPATAPDRYSWGAGTAEFLFDKTLNDPAPTPMKDAVVTEMRPFVMLTYEDKTTVTINEFKIDGTVQEVSDLGGNRFLYWPEMLALGKHEISVKATDAAGVEDTFEYSFKSAERSAFGLKLIAGWNAVSFPANPMDPMIESVFTDSQVDMVAGWDASDPEKPWSIATRMEDEWSTHEEFATLNKIHAQYGYWVHSLGFTTQRVQLVAGPSRTDPNVVPADLVTIPTMPGWNFVGVIDQDGDQTQDDFGEKLMNRDEAGDQTTVKAGDYLGTNKRAYTWDPIRSKFDVIEDDDELQIGDGIWVYFGPGIAP